MQNVAFIINPFSAKKNYQPFLTSLKQKVENPLYIISKSIEDTEHFIQNNFEKIEKIAGDNQTILDGVNELILIKKYLIIIILL